MSENSRTSRSQEEREVEERRNQIFNKLRMSYNGPLDFPVHEIPDGIEYCLVRHTVLGDPSWSRVPEMMERGWTFVPPSRHPSFMNYDPFNKSVTKDYIEKKGAIYMQRPKEFGDEERRLEREYQLKVLNQSPADGALMMEAHQNQTPLFLAENKSSRTFG